MMGNRKLASTAPPIRGNYQLMLIVGGEETREGEDCGGWDDRKGSRWR
jgi:hypothetical protein